MSDDEENLQKKANSKCTVGEDLSGFSITELTIRITTLNEEVERVNRAITKKQSQAGLAENLFKKEK